MKAVMPEVPPDILAWRKRTGADQWDEVWEGVLHMTPSPNREHQDFEFSLEAWLRTHWAEPGGNEVYHQINVAAGGVWTENYRIPDLVLLTPDRFHIDRNEYFEGAPSVVVEIHSPGDEAYEKLAFYAKIGVPEVWIIDRDTKAPAVYVLRGDRYEQQAPAPDGWVPSTAIGVQMRGEPGRKLAIQMTGDDTTHRLLPKA